jgi:hypothetical protein
MLALLLYVLPHTPTCSSGEDGGTTIHQGSCMFGHIDANKGTGWNVAALTDGSSDYKGEMCASSAGGACRLALSVASALINKIASNSTT